MTLTRVGLIAACFVISVPAMAQRASGDEDKPHPSVCTEQYLPVCGRLNTVVRTYPNQCYARAAGAEVIAQGPCSDTRLPAGR